MKTPYIILPLILILYISCEEENDEEEEESQTITETDSLICVTGECQGLMVLEFDQDENGLYHVPLDLSGQYYPRFNLYVEGSKLIDECQYNSVSVVSSYFDTDTYWLLNDSVSFVLPLYNPWTSLYTNPSWDTPISIGDTTIILSQFDGYPVPIVQKNVRIYLGEYFSGSDFQPPDEYRPSDPDQYLWSKRIVGPIHPTLVGDTVTIYMEMIWDCGDRSISRNDFYTQIVLE